MSATVLGRKLRSVILKFARWFASFARILTVKILCDGVSVPWSVSLGKGVVLRATDGGRIVVGSGTCVSSGSRFTAQGGDITIGANCFIGIGCVMVCKSGIDIGDDALIAEYVTIRDQDHSFPAGVLIREAGFESAPIFIGKDVWIGAKSSILRGSRIGKGCVVGAHSVVKGSVPESSIVAGAPARSLRKRGP